LRSGRRLWLARGFVLLMALALFSIIAFASEQLPGKSQGAYTGSQSCRECHERFYKLWAPSHHGKAMQLYSDAFAAESLTRQTEPIVIKNASYIAQTGLGQGWVLEKAGGKEKRLPIKHALGGKNIFYFLTPLDQGRLQTLPVAYDIKKKAWFDTAKSGVRHAGGEPVDWRDASFTFNTSCHGCHVSQYSQNFDLKTRTYRTTWQEPGINCETCHGPGEEHNRVCRAAPKGTVPKDLKITRGGRSFTHAQNNATCSSCHAKAIPLTRSFMPGDKFWDHFDLAVLEHPDYYPDGRDLGENYTYTSWLLSPCVKAGNLDCLHCHTSSGRFRQKKDPNQACLPCHDAKVKEIAAHSRHKPGPQAPTCVSCHMPMTSFARMHRSDHSMLPPAPAASLKYGSPNACNLCHKGKDATWADKEVRKWHKEDYQKTVLHRAGLIEAARKRDWSRLPGMLAYIVDKERDEVFAASLIRLLKACPRDIKWPIMLAAAKDSSPLVRASALDALAGRPSPETARLLLTALDDPYKLVRIRAAKSLAGYNPNAFSPAARKKLARATGEMLNAFLARPDTWSAHYNVGNFYLDHGRIRQALYSYGLSLDLEPRAVMPMVNMAMAYVRAGKPGQAESLLQKALKLEPENATANFNLGLLKAETGDKKGAERYLRAALKADPAMSRAAYNLALLVFAEKPKEAMQLGLQAFEQHPTARYGFTLAYFMNQAGDQAGAEKMLDLVIKRWPWHADSYLLLTDIYLASDEKTKAQSLLKKALEENKLGPRDRRRLILKLNSLNGRTRG
jgi:Flp pilus assembly protein TadD